MRLIDCLIHFVNCFSNTFLQDSSNTFLTDVQEKCKTTVLGCDFIVELNKCLSVEKAV